MENSTYKRLRISEPMLHSYTVLGAIFSIAESKDMPYFYNEFVQLKYHEDWGMYIFDAHQDLLEMCPFLGTEHYTFNDDVGYEEIINQIVKFLERDYYVYIFLDWHYLIPKEIHYNFAHTALISGYDIEKGVFWVSDNLDNGRFVTIEVEMKVVAKAFKSAWSASVGNAYDNDGSSHFSYLKDVTVFRYRNEVQINFDKSILVSEIKSYLYSLDNNLLHPSNTELCGMNSYSVLMKSFDDSEDYKVSRKDYHMLYEHKLLMYKRIEFLYKNNYIIDNCMLVEQAQKIKEGFMIARNLSMKKTMVDEGRRCDIENKTKMLIQELIELERNMLEELILALE